SCRAHTGASATEMVSRSVQAARAVGLVEVSGVALPTDLAAQRAWEKAGLRRQREVEHAGPPHWFGRVSLPPPGKPELRSIAWLQKGACLKPRPLPHVDPLARLSLLRRIL